MKRTLLLALFVVMVVQPVARAGQVAVRVSNAAAVDGAALQLDLMVGRSAVIRTDRPIARVALSTPEIADALVTSSRELLVHGKAPGSISLLVWADNGRIATYEVSVRRDLSPLEAQVRSQFPNEHIEVTGNGKDVVLSGIVSTKYVIDRAGALAVGYVDKKESVVNLLRQQQSLATNQVMLKVRFAEVSRTAMQELGASFFTGPNGKGDWVARGTTQQFPAPDFDREKGLVFSDFLNLFAFNTEEQLGTAIKALKGRGLFESLAEPNLITQDGVEASFLAGGEYPYPIPQASAGGTTITILFKEFGVKLRFTPTITSDDHVQLKVSPEVSTLDFSNALVLEGFRIPALTTRRTETQVELRDGQTFAIAGLLDRSLNETLRRVPGIGDIPILGYLFRSQAYQKNNTELVVMITPHIIRRDSPGVTPQLPGLVQPFMGAPDRTIAPPPPAFPYQGQVPSMQPGRSAGSTQPRPTPQTASSAPLGSVPADAPGAPVAPIANAADAVAPVRLSAEDRRAIKAAAEQDRRAQALARAEETRLREAAKIEGRRQAQERRLEEKRAAEQAVIDRKRWLTQQDEAARAKGVADKLAREQARRDAEQARIEAARLEEERKLAEKHRKAKEKLIREQAERDAEMHKLLEQYKKLSCCQDDTTQTGR